MIEKRDFRFDQIGDDLLPLAIHAVGDGGHADGRHDASLPVVNGQPDARGALQVIAFVASVAEPAA